MFKEIFFVALSQMSVLFIFILIGFILRKTNILKQEAIRVLSKIVSNVFLPLVLLKSFMTSFSVDSLSKNGIILLFSLIVTFLSIFLGLFLGKILIKNDDWLKKMVQYGLIYSNFAYMGIPIIQAINSDFEASYLIFTIVPQFCFTLWAIPYLLVPKQNQGKETLKSYVKRLLNPIFVCLILGVILGLTGVGIWITKNLAFVYSAISAGAACMSPVAMILTGVVIASYNIVPCLKNIKLYITSILRLIVIPALFALVFILLRNVLPLDEDILSCLLICILTYLAMPLGLNTIIIPASFDQDVIDCAGMTLISSIIGIITIPVIFALFLSI